MPLAVSWLQLDWINGVTRTSEMVETELVASVVTDVVFAAAAFGARNRDHFVFDAAA